MKNYRSRAEIISQMLEVVMEELEGSTKTKIMYKACLSSTQLKNYLRLAIDRDLLEQDVLNGSSRYKLTQKGVQYLEMFRQTRKISEI